MEHLRQQLKTVRSDHLTSSQWGLVLTLLDIERRLLGAWRIASLLSISQNSYYINDLLHLQSSPDPC